MKRLLVAVFVMVLGATLNAQKGELLIRSSSKGLYLEHKVTPKENFYSIGRLYNVHPKHLASFNGIDMSKGLSLGQALKIPLSDTNFNQKSDKGTPIYYTVKEKEGLLTVSNNNKKVLMESLRKWNHLRNDKISSGRKLIVGFLNTDNKAAVAATPPKTEEKKQEEVYTPSQEEQKKQTVVTEPPAKPQEEPYTPSQEEQKKQTVATEQPVVKKDTDLKQGYFKTSFDQQVKQDPIKKEQAVTAGIFKTTSGWTDAKYYLLADGVEPGTVIKITNPTNNKIIYAKVLGEMNGVTQSQGLNIRISNAAAAALEIQETDKFIVKLNY